MFRMWHRFKIWKSNQEKRGIKISMTVLESQLQAIRARIKALLEEGAKRGVPKCGTILKVEPLLWAFTRVEGIEPTNISRRPAKNEPCRSLSFFINIAERAVRPAVLWKKRSFGVESERGARYVESMLSIWATCRRNGVSPIAFMRELIHNHRTNAPVPSIFSAPTE
jgi:transposase